MLSPMLDAVQCLVYKLMKTTALEIRKTAELTSGGVNNRSVLRQQCRAKVSRHVVNDTYLPIKHWGMLEHVWKDNEYNLRPSKIDLFYLSFDAIHVGYYCIL